MSFASYPSLADRVVLVTGGASGIGADIVRAFAGQGARTAFVDILDAEAEALAAEIGGDHPPLYCRCDLTDIAALQDAIAEIGHALGPIGVLVNNAANDQRQTIAEITPELWDLSQNINLRPHFFAAQAVHQQMRSLGGGAIINLSSITWQVGVPELAAYTAAKAGIIGLTRSLGRAFGADNIRVNAIEPGAVMTDRQRRLWYPTEALVEAMVERQTLHYVLGGDEIARAVLFLAADDSRMITKQTITVDAGIR